MRARAQTRRKTPPLARLLAAAPEDHDLLRHLADAALLARRRVCYCDVYWDGPLPDGVAGLDLECQSASHHFGAKSSVSDADRATALQAMGIEVAQVTFPQIADPVTFEVFSEYLARRLGISRPEKNLAPQPARSQTPPQCRRRTPGRRRRPVASARD